MEKKIEFLYRAIADAQELVRFIDSKTTLVIAIIGAYATVFFSSIDKIIIYWSEYSFIFYLIFFFFILFFVLCVIVTTRIIRPTHNPNDNINSGGRPAPILKFYLPQNNYKGGVCHFFCNSKKLKLSENIDKYIRTIDGAEDNDIIASLTFELFKISYIRNIKNERYHFLLRLLLITTLLFFGAYTIYSVQIHDIAAQQN